MLYVVYMLQGISLYVDMFEKEGPPERVVQELPKERHARQQVIG
jgi:hypothetical protein